LDVERKFDANVYLWSPREKAEGWDGDEPGAYVDLHELDGRVERVDQNHVKYFLDLNAKRSHANRQLVDQVDR
jgi:hypothetical protein